MKPTIDAISPEQLQAWKRLADEAIEILPGYKVSKDGRIFSTGHNWRGYGVREMKLHPNSHGYLRVKLTINGRSKNYMVHKLVAEAFIGKRPNAKYQICHKNGLRTDNRVENLYYGTARENAKDRTNHGNCKAAENGKKYAYKLIKIHCKRGHVLVPENRNKKGYCKICQKDYHDKKRARNKIK